MGWLRTAGSISLRFSIYKRTLPLCSQSAIRIKGENVSDRCLLQFRNAARTLHAIPFNSLLPTNGLDPGALFLPTVIFSIGFFVYCFSLKLTKGVWQWFNLSPHKEGHRFYSYNVKPLQPGLTVKGLPSPRLAT